MKEGVGDKLKREKHFYDRLTQGDPDIRFKAMAEMGIFRKEIIDLKSHDPNGFLLNIDVEKLDSTDLLFYRRFKEGEADITGLQAQLRVLTPLPESASSRKLMNYLLYQIEERKNKGLRRAG